MNSLVTYDETMPQHGTGRARLARAAEDYRRVEQAIEFLEHNFRRQPDLGEIAAGAGLSEYHFQRLFARWVGISPKRFLQFLTKEYAKELLAESRDLLQVADESGLSGPGRLHDLFVTCEAMTPGEFKSRGAGLRIRYGFHPTPFGECALLSTERGICGLTFVREGRASTLGRIRKELEKASLVEDERSTGALAARAFGGGSDGWPLHLYVRGTNFQIKVWEALLRIPSGTVATYEEVADSIGVPGGARAVGNAVGSNPIPLLIPCHRVIRSTGEFGNYGGGPLRKMAMLGWEAARRRSAESAH
jgi:AraC family transcriptional regulator, regulatory protein of adaptative response / methylated-DNA-[protein]-cysteine methyltransferase